MTSDPIARYLTQRTSKMDRRNRLRVMQGNEVVDVAIRIYQVLGWSFLKATVVPAFFCLAASTFFLRYVWPSYFVTERPDSQAAQFGEVAANTGVALFVAAPLFLLGMSYASAVVTRLASDYMLGNAPDLGAASEKARSLLPRLTWLHLREILLASAGILAGLGLLMTSGLVASSTAESDATAGVILILAWAGLVAGAVFFLYVVQRHALAPAALVLEDLDAGEAARRSSQLMRRYGVHPSGGGAVWSLYVLLLLLWLLIGWGVSASLEMVGYPENVRAWIAGLPFSGLFVEALGLVPAFLVIWTLVPVWAATNTIIYYDRRIRLEGYDIEALAEDVWRADRSRRFEL